MFTQRNSFLATVLIIFSLVILAGSAVLGRGGRVGVEPDYFLATTATPTVIDVGGLTAERPSTLKLAYFLPLTSTPVPPTPTPTSSSAPTPTPPGDCVPEGEGEPRAMLIYDAQPQAYSWTVAPPKYGDDSFINEAFINYQGQTFTGNQNHYGIEVYKCESGDGAIVNERGKPLDYATKRTLDICVPRRDLERRWPADVFPNTASLSCREAQFLVDGPPQAYDRNAENQTKDICTRDLDTPGANPHIEKTIEFEFREYMREPGNEVVLAGRPDPANPECAGLPENPTQTPLDLTPSQLSCYLYFDDAAYVSVWKEDRANARSQKVVYSRAGGVHPLPGPSVSLTALFAEGEGNYKVNIRVFDEGDSVYGAADLWLTWKGAPEC